MTLPITRAVARVAHVIAGLDTGGAEMMLLKLVRGSNTKFAHDVISLSTVGEIGRSFEEAGAVVHALHLKRGALPMFDALSLVKLLSQLQPEIIQGWMYHGNVACICARSFTRRRSVLSWSIRCSLNESGLDKWLTWGVVRLGAFLSLGPSAIIYNSHLSRAQHEGIGYSGKHATVIPNGFDTRAFQSDQAARTSTRQRLLIPPSSISVGLVARNHPVKDHHTFLAAAIKVSREQPRAVFVAAGRGVPELARSMPDLVGELGPRLLLLPEQRDIAAFMNGLDICVLSSLAEGFPNVLGEAMACGVPCIATDVGDCAAIVSDTGLIVPPRSPDRLASAIIELASADPSYRRELGVKARKRVVDHYSLATVVGLYERVWRRAIELNSSQESSSQGD